MWPDVPEGWPLGQDFASENACQLHFETADYRNLIAFLKYAFLAEMANLLCYCLIWFESEI